MTAASRGLGRPPIPGQAILRVDWVPGADQLLGTCHCGAERVTDSPQAVWAWLLDHPHREPPAPDAAAGAAPAAPVTATRPAEPEPAPA